MDVGSWILLLAACLVFMALGLWAIATIFPTGHGQPRDHAPFPARRASEHPREDHPAGTLSP